MVITINKTHFFHNLDIIAQKTKSKDKIALVLKDNAYGHGLELIATLAKEYGIKKAIVQKTDEAKTLIPYFDYILVLSDIPQKSVPSFHYTINSLDDITNFPKETKVHLKVDTGMHRNGIMPKDLSKAFELIQKHSLDLKAVFTHHRSADELTSEWFWQNKNFETIKQRSLKLAKKYNIPSLEFHKDNSASLMRTHNFKEDFARVGIAAYGCLELPKPLQNTTKLKPILSLYAHKIATKKLPKGSRIGYGGSGILKENATISTYDIGYGDGFFRSLSDNFVTPKGLKLIGRISMDNTSFLSDEKELLLFEDANKVAKQIGTIGYEVLTSLKPDIQRIVV